MQDRTESTRSALAGSYAVVMLATLALAAAVALLMSRLTDTIADSLDDIVLQYEDASLSARLERDTLAWAVKAADLFADEEDDRVAEAGDLEDREEALEATLAALAEHKREVGEVEGDEEAGREAEELEELAERIEGFRETVEGLFELDPEDEAFEERRAAAFDDQLNDILADLDEEIEAERQDLLVHVGDVRERIGQWSWGVGALILLAVAVILAPLYVRLDFGIRRLAAGAQRLAAGDFGARIAPAGVFKEIALTFNEMAQQIERAQEAQARTAKELQASSAELLAIAAQTETNASEQAAAVDETRRTMQALLGTSIDIAEGAGTASSRAEQAAGASRVIGERILELKVKSQRIRKISDTIRSIAEKSDILALNASLEGSKAGEAGRGFVLLGNEMRRLAETVSAAANEVGDLALEIGEFSQSTVLSTEEGQKLVGETVAVARRITLVTSQQRTATEQVTRSMDEVHQYTQHSLAGAKQARATASDLARAADELERLTSTAGAA